MATPINVEQDKPSNLGGFLGPLLGVAGAVAAPFTFGASMTLPAALAAGAGLGEAAGGFGGGIADAAINSGKDNFQGLPTGGQPSSIDRRTQAVQDNPLNHVMGAIGVLHNLDPVLQKKVAPALYQAVNNATYQKNGWGNAPDVTGSFESGSSPLYLSPEGA